MSVQKNARLTAHSRALLVSRVMVEGSGASHLGMPSQEGGEFSIATTGEFIIGSSSGRTRMTWTRAGISWRT